VISDSALTTAAARAAHLLVDEEPVIHRDSLAFGLLGDRADKQAHKRDRLAALGIHGGADYLAVDFESDDVLGALVTAGFDRARPAVFGWLGVSMYLTEPAIGAVLDLVAGCAPGTELVFDHVLPAGERDADGQVYAEAVAGFAARGGEPWLSLLGPGDTAALAAAHGLAVVEHRDQADAVPAALWQRTDVLKPVRRTALTRVRAGSRDR
jgi:O-methyltransferase involved in polyketide biosynthesis